MSTSDKIKTMEPRTSFKLGRSATIKLDKPKRALRAARKKAVELFYNVKERLQPEQSLWLPNDRKWTSDDIFIFPLWVIS